MATVVNHVEDRFPDIEIAIYANGDKLIIAVNREQCLARMTLPCDRSVDPLATTDIILFEPRWASEPTR